jgi:hypothetical protein
VGGLLIVLWVRGHSYLDGLEKLTSSRLFHVWSVNGRLAVEQITPPINIGRNTLGADILRRTSWGGTYGNKPAEWSGNFIEAMGEPVMGFGYATKGSTNTTISAPHWAFVALFGTLAAAPWIRNWSWQFRLRTLLIATTLVAVVLGLAVAFR